MIAVQREFPRALVLRQNTGVAQDRKGQVIKFGTPGQGDVRCVIGGRAVEIEVKTPKGKQSEKQQNYQAALERAGGIYILARSINDAIGQIKWQISQTR